MPPEIDRQRKVKLEFENDKDRISEKRDNEIERKGVSRYTRETQLEGRRYLNECLERRKQSEEVIER